LTHLNNSKLKITEVTHIKGHLLELMPVCKEQVVKA